MRNHMVTVDIAYIGIHPPELPGYTVERVRTASFPILYGEIADTLMEYCTKTLPFRYVDAFPRAVWDAVGLGPDRRGSDYYPSKSPVLFVVFRVRKH